MNFIEKRFQVITYYMGNYFFQLQILLLFLASREDNGFAPRIVKQEEKVTDKIYTKHIVSFLS